MPKPRRRPPAGTSRRPTPPGRALHLEPLEDRRLLAGVPVPIDVNQVLSSVGGLSGPLVDVGGVLYFAANDGASGVELWKSNGTAAGTTLVKDILPGAAPSYPSDLTNVGGTLFFVALNATGRRELWKSTGTSFGTVRVKDIQPGGPIEPSFHAIVGNLVNVNGTLFFSANDGAGYELWKSNGTEAGTTMVRDIGASPLGAEPRYLTNVGGTLYFTANDGTTGTELWKSTGTTAGTTRVADVRPGADGSLPQRLTNVNGTLFFRADDGTSGFELWKSNGTAAGTTMVKDLNGTLDNFTNIGSTLFFDRSGELWKSDGTGPGTVQLFKWSGPYTGLTSTRFVEVSGTLYFSVFGDPTFDALPTKGTELWKTTGTAASTMLVADVAPGTANSLPGNLINLAGTLYFTANDGASGVQLWKSTGTELGTQRVTNPGTVSFPALPRFTALGNVLYFIGDDGATGAELWKSNGTAAGTARVDDILAAHGTQASAPDHFAAGGDGYLYFAANDGASGVELWKSLGTPATTMRVSDIAAGAASSSPTSIVAVGNTIYFAANDGASGVELWKSDGTAAGTVRVRDIVAGAGSSNPASLWNVDGVLYFAAGDALGRELWKSDGTADGTVLEAEVNAGPPDSSVQPVANIGGVLYFLAADPTDGVELWRTDASNASGIRRLSTVGPGAVDAALAEFVVVGGTLYFTGHDGTSRGLWKSDGSVDGTVRLGSVKTPPGNSDDRSYANVGGTLYFSGNDGTTGYELWKTNGTTLGTVRVKDIVTGVGDSRPTFLTNVSGTLYFSATDPTNGRELWKSDGAAIGTVRVSNLDTSAAPGDPGSDAAGPREITNFQGSVFFTAREAASGTELWVSNGTLATTLRVTDLAGGRAGELSGPTRLTPVRSILFYRDDDGLLGDELWALPIPIPGDYDASGEVNGADVLLWQRTLGSVANPAGSGADGNGNGGVDAPDLAIWKLFFGQPLSAPAATPSTIAMTSPLQSLGEESAAAQLLVDQGVLDAAFAGDDLAEVLARTRGRSPRRTRGA